MKDSIVLPVNPLTLRFHKDQHHIEKEYQSFSFKNNLGHIRICHLLAILLYGIFIFLDSRISPENVSIFITIRFAIVIPVFCIGIVLTYLSWYQYICNYMLGLYVLLTAGSYIYMGFLVPANLHFVYFIGFVICLIFGYTLIRLPFLFASASGWIPGIAYWIIQFNYVRQNETAFIIYTAYLLAFEFLLMIICYTAERANRNNFYLFHLLSVEQDKTEKVNDELEDIVRKRTVELQELSDALKKIKTLSGLLPICSSCKKIRDDKGYWNQIESYLLKHSEAEFSHSICPECVNKLYGDEDWYKKIHAK